MNKTIGHKIKTLREDAKISIEDMATKIGVNISKLEKIESAEVSPTISILIKITRVLGLRLGTILDGEEQSEVMVVRATNTTPTVSTANGEVEDRDNLNFHSLASNKKDRNMEPLIVDVQYVSPQGNLSIHEGEEFIYVLEGELSIVYGNKKHSLSKGDSIYYDSVVPHIVTTPSENHTAKILAVIYTPL